MSARALVRAVSVKWERQKVGLGEFQNLRTLDCIGMFKIGQT